MGKPVHLNSMASFKIKMHKCQSDDQGLYKTFKVLNDSDPVFLSDKAEQGIEVIHQTEVNLGHASPSEADCGK